mmetsp:Transcript_16820/g.43497  ORF Transcript_16820/g.43497 Transcript_16820/m.43497 type:complete len:290 (-) Transcript_16820:398-1267(-)
MGDEGRALLASPMQDSMVQAQLQSGGGAYLENSGTVALGVCYECACCCCATLGLSANLVTVDQGCVGVVTSFGKYHRTLPPGRHRFNVMSEKVFSVNLKVVCLDVEKQAAMTKDNLTVTIDAVCYYQVFDAEKAVFGVENYTYALSNLTQITMRTIFGEHTLSEIFADRMKINARLKTLIDEATHPWGIKVIRVEMKTVEIDPAMQRALAAKAEAQQDAEAKLIQAHSQRDAAGVLAEAAERMSQHPGALKLQWMETLRIISTQGKNTTIIVPDGMGGGEALAFRAAGR